MEDLDGTGRKGYRDLALLPLLVHGLGIVHTGYCLTFLLSPPQSLLNPGFNVARQLLPMRDWGILFGIIAVIHAYGVLRSARVARFGLWVGAWIALFWAACYGVNFYNALQLPATDPASHTTPLGVVVTGFLGAASLICAMSVVTPEEMVRRCETR